MPNSRTTNQNARTHGLCSKLPDVLTADLISQEHAKLITEFNPQTGAESILVREMARHSAALVRAEVIEQAVLRRGAAAAHSLDSPAPEGLSVTDVMLACAGTSDSLNHISRYRKSHERAFLRSMTAIRKLRHHRSEAVRSAPPAPTFESESDCDDWLTD
jgi:hypothetical protein